MGQKMVRAVICADPGPLEPGECTGLHCAKCHAHVAPPEISEEAADAIDGAFALCQLCGAQVAANAASRRIGFG